MAESTETVDIQNPDNPSEKMTINAADYDPETHTLWESDDDGESVPDETNAAVLEAPGSTAAQQILQGRPEPEEDEEEDEDTSSEEPAGV